MNKSSKGKRENNCYIYVGWANRQQKKVSEMNMMEGISEVNLLRNNSHDSFDSIFNKELDLDIEEVPMVLYELHENAIYYIEREEWEKALVLLQKAQIIIEQANVERFKKDRLVIIIIFHNTALCYQMLGSLEDASLFLETCILNLEILSMMPCFQKTEVKSNILSLECILRMQLCALLSQLHRHQEALYHCQIAVRIGHFIFKDLKRYCESLVYRESYANIDKKQDEETDSKHQNSPKANSKLPTTRIEVKTDRSMDMNKLRSSARKGNMELKKKDTSRKGSINSASTDDSDGEPMSIFHKGYKKIYPILKEFEKYLVKEDNLQSKLNNFSTDQKDTLKNKERFQYKVSEQEKLIKSRIEEITKNEEVNLENMLGFINQKKLNSYLNISNIMRLNKLDFNDLYYTRDLDMTLTRKPILEKIMLIITSYFCMGTELRFLKQLQVDGFKDSVEAQFWHGNALEMAFVFLPSESPYVKHLVHSYTKHHSPSSQSIPEGYEMAPNVKILRALRGVHNSKSNPIIQDCDYIYNSKSDLDIESKVSKEFSQNMIKHIKNAMVKISPLDMPNNDYFKYIDDKMIELGVKNQSRTNENKQRKSIASERESCIMLNKVQTRDQEVQVAPDFKPTKVYIDRALSAKCLTTKVFKPKLKQTTDAAVNTKERFILTQKNDSRYSSGNSSLNTPSSGALFANRITKNSQSRHSNELERQYMLKKKYNEKLQNYPHTRLTPGSYDSQDRPNSIAGSIKLRKSHDSSQSSLKSNKLEMYDNKKYNSSKNHFRKSENNQVLSQNNNKRRTSSSKRRYHQNSNKIFVNKHLTSLDHGAAERGQGLLPQGNTAGSNMSFDEEVNNISKGHRSNHSLSSIDHPRQNRYSKISMANPSISKPKMNPIRISNKGFNNRSNSSSTIKKKKSKSSNLSVSRIDQSFPRDDNNYLKDSGSTKVRKGTIEMKIKSTLNDQMSTLQHQINIMSFGQNLKTPQFKIPSNQFQIKKQYFTKGFSESNSNRRRKKSQEQKEKINHSMIYDQVSRLNR
ncbi:unnamed protein product [Moneuplotes crassus]|uniref:Uncharacterized protein n=1 Tax=Euplotes crassus TaxID=5936 RepID=A0AAD1XNH8_EUPCR|nr:unnamed protein product [Moneuplotes crassus]